MSSHGPPQTWATLLIFMLAAVRNPDAVKKAQEEIDRVVGPGRLPTFDDMDALPYVGCLLKETIRCVPRCAVA